MQVQTKQKNQLTHFAEMTWVRPASTASLDAVNENRPVEARPRWERHAWAVVADFLDRALVTPIVCHRRRQRMRRELMSLDDRTLTDIGLSRSDIPLIVEEACRDTSRASEKLVGGGVLRHPTFSKAIVR